MLATVIVIVFTTINLKLIQLSMVSYDLKIFVRIKLAITIVISHAARIVTHHYLMAIGTIVVAVAIIN